MLRKVLVAVILAVFMLSTQTTFAEIPIDWSKVKKVNSKSALRAYMDEANKSGQTIVPVILTDGLTLRESELLELSSSSMIRYNVKGSNAQNVWLILTLQEYPGTRVANAYLSGDTDWLSTDEMKLYKVAVGIVDKIKQDKSNRGLEDRSMRIYEEIINRVTYVSGDMNHQPRFVTAIGALIDGKANCQGYTDAFYMLGRMCGLNVGRISGTANGNPHMWNTVNYSREKGSTYFVDVTWGDSRFQKSTDGTKADSYIYFNAPVEIMQVTHKWYASLAPRNLQPDVDYEYSYSKFWRGNLARATSAEAGLQLLANKLNDGKHTWFSVMTPYDERYSPANKDRIIDYVKKNITKKMTFNVHWLRYGKYMFYTGRIV